MKDLATAFTKLHTPGDPLVLYNIWDAGSARAVADAGASAIATGSASVAGAQGYDDGEQLPLADLARTTAQIVRAVSLPVTVDMESGYGDTAASVGATASRLAAAGAIGCNFEDQIMGDSDEIYAVADQTDRIAGVVAATPDDFHVNARTDLFLKEADESRHGALLPAALERAHAYRDAGAKSFFAPWLVDLALIEQLCRDAPLPVNVMWRAGMATIKELAGAGVARVSFGPGPYRDAMQHLGEQAARYF